MSKQQKEQLATQRQLEAEQIGIRIGEKAFNLSFLPKNDIQQKAYKRLNHPTQKQYPTKETSNLSVLQIYNVRSIKNKFTYLGSTLFLSYFVLQYQYSFRLIYCFLS